MMPVISLCLPIVSKHESVLPDLSVQQGEFTFRAIIRVSRVEIDPIQALVGLILQPFVGEGHLDYAISQAGPRDPFSGQFIRAMRFQSSIIGVAGPVRIVLSERLPPWIDERDV